MGKNLGDLSLLRHAAIVQNGNMLADLFYNAHLMGDDHHRDPQLFVDPADQLQDGVCCGRIQRAGGLIAKQHLGIGRQGSGNGHALLLSAGQLCRICVGFLPQAYDVQQFQGSFFGFRFIHTGKLQRKTHIFQAVSLHQQVEPLEDHGDALPHGSELRLRQGRQVTAVDLHTAFAGSFQHIDAAHQRALSGAAHTDDAEDISVRDGEGDILQSFNSAVSCMICFG